MREPEGREGAHAGGGPELGGGSAAGGTSAAGGAREQAEVREAHEPDGAEPGGAQGSVAAAPGVVEAGALTGSSGVSGATHAADAAEDRFAVRSYDFRQPSRISKDRLRTLRGIHGLMSKALEGWLTGRVRGPTELELESLDQQSFGELVFSIPAPCCSYIYDVADSGGQQMLIDFDAGLSFLLVDRLLGGGCEPVEAGRPLTMIEREVVRIVADRVATELVEAWKEHVRFGLTLNRFESIPDVIQIANREDPILVAVLRVRVEEVEGAIRLCLPFAVLEKFFSGAGARRVRGGGGSEEERAADREGVEAAIRSSGVEVSARLPAFEVRLGRLTQLEVGDVLETGLDTDVAIEVQLNGQDRVRARAGRVGRRLALELLDWIGPAVQQAVPARGEDQE